MMKKLTMALLFLALASTSSAALDSKQKRGSVINIGQPGRPWLSEPDGSDLATDTERMSALTYAAAVSPISAGIVIPIFMHHYRQLREAGKGDS